MVLSDLDRKSKQVLEAVYEHGGDAQVGEVSDFTGIKSTQIHYRIDEKLEPGGLVESRKIDAEGPMGVKVVSLTDDGTEVVGQVLDEDSGPTVVEQVRELRAVVESLNDTVQSFDGRLDHVESRISDVEETTEAQVEEVLGRLRDREALAEAIDDVEAIEELDELVETAREIEEQYSAVIERNHELQQRLQDMQEVEEAFRENGLLERSSTDSLVGTSDLHRFRKLAKKGVFTRLIEALDEGDR